MKKHTLTIGCLLGDQAAACLMRLITGEKGSRGYTYSCGEEYGYFYDPFLKKWMAFDNRHKHLSGRTMQHLERGRKLSL